MRIAESWWPAEPSGAPDMTLGDALRDAAHQWPHSTALVEGVKADARTWTFSSLLADSERMGRFLAERYRPGTKVAVWSTNSPEWLLVQYGAALAGLTLVTVNPAYRAEELSYVLGNSRAEAVFVQPELRSRDLLGVAHDVSSQLPQACVVHSMAELDQMIASLDPCKPLPAVSPTDPAQIQYTSGTTGFPKGALLAHRGLAKNGRNYAVTIGAGPQDVWVNPMPLFHTAGCGLATLGALQTGGCQVLVPGFGADLVLDLFEMHQGTIMLSVPTMLIRVLEAQRARRRDIGAWRLSTLGGAPVPAELVRQAADELGVQVAIGFGQTESSPYITHTRVGDDHPRWVETVGAPLPDVEVKIGGSDGSVVPVGEMGEICTRGVCVMLEYFENPQGTAEVIDADGWLHTGDIGSMDEHGYVSVHGRIKDLIIRGGENVYPREVEDHLFEHPGVVNVAVVGLPDDEWGEIVAAFVQVRGAVTEAELKAHLGRIASYKIPQVWQFVDSFPQTASGKIQKFALRDHFLATSEDEM